MTAMNHPQLQRLSCGHYNARGKDHIVANAGTYEALSGVLDRRSIDWDTRVIAYIEPVSSIRAYRIPAPATIAPMRPCE